jgi:hypothetical protein
LGGDLGDIVVKDLVVLDVELLGWLLIVELRELVTSPQVKDKSALYRI